MEPTTAAQTPRFKIIMHEQPDFDCLAALFIFLEAHELLFDDVDYAFVPCGCRYSGPNEEGFILVHLDTGGIYNPATYDFDHHQNRARWPSAARTVYEAYKDRFAGRDDLDDLVKCTDRVDSPGAVNDNKDELQAYQQLISSAKEINRGFQGGNKFYITRALPGPMGVVSMFANSTLLVDSGEISEMTRLHMGVLELKCWTLKKAEIPRFLNAVKTQATIETNSAGVRIMHLPPQPVRMKLLRYYLRRYFRDKADAVLYQSGEETDIYNGRYCILLLNPDKITGLAQIQTVLTSVGKCESFMFEGGKESDSFVIYIKPSPNIEYKDLLSFARKLLHPRLADSTSAALAQSA